MKNKAIEKHFIKYMSTVPKLPENQLQEGDKNSLLFGDEFFSLNLKDRTIDVVDFGKLPIPAAYFETNAKYPEWIAIVYQSTQTEAVLVMGYGNPFNTTNQQFLPTKNGHTSASPHSLNKKILKKNHYTKMSSYTA